jgi:uncharacterized phage-associated protein
MKKSITIANKFLDLAAEDSNTLSPMQLLKLVYIAHGWHLGLYHTPLICDEVQAWQYGPVIPQLYNKIRGYRGTAVTKRISDSNSEVMTEREENLIQQVYKIYGRKTGMALSRITHAPNTPWSLTYTPGVFSIPIPNDLIEDHYVRLAG